MMDERTKILEMLKDGVITVEQADELLGAIEDDKKFLKNKHKEKILKAKELIKTKLSVIEKELDKVGTEVATTVSETLKDVDSLLNKIMKKEKENNNNDWRKN